MISRLSSSAAVACLLGASTVLLSQQHQVQALPRGSTPAFRRKLDDPPFEISSDGCQVSSRRARSRRIMAGVDYSSSMPTTESAAAMKMIKSGGYGKGATIDKKDTKSSAMDMQKKSTKSYGSPVSGGGDGDKPYCTEYCDMLDSYEFPTTSYTIHMTLSVLDTIEAALAELEHLFQTEIAGSLAVCYDGTTRRKRRRLSQTEGTLLAAEFSVAEDTASGCSGVTWDSTYEGACAKVVVTATVTYDIGKPDQFAGVILDAVTDSCDAIAALEAVEEAFDPCPYIQIQPDEGVTEDGGENTGGGGVGVGGGGGGSGNDQQGVDGDDGDNDNNSSNENSDSNGDSTTNGDNNNQQQNENADKGGTQDLDEDLKIDPDTKDGPIHALESPSDDSSSSRGRKSGAALGAIFGFLVIVGTIYFFLKIQRKRDDNSRDGLLVPSDEKDGQDLSSLDDTTLDSNSPGRTGIRTERDLGHDEESPNEEDRPVSVKNPQPPIFVISDIEGSDDDDDEPKNPNSPSDAKDPTNQEVDIDVPADDMIVDTGSAELGEKVEASLNTDDGDVEETAQEQPTSNAATEQPEHDVHKCTSATCTQCVPSSQDDNNGVTFVAVEKETTLPEMD